MTKPQISIRITPPLLEKLNNYVERTGTSKTEVVVGAIANYLDCAEDIPLSQRMASVERRLAELEAEMRAKNN
ncbi:MAG: ribbon-helix-helix protein, CopG family [Xenococcaceae cyanobacterium]